MKISKKWKKVARDIGGDSVEVKVGGVVYLVTHYDDYGVVVRGGMGEVSTARKALKSVGYKGVKRLAYRPTMLEQTPREWPYGLATGGTPAVCFYFSNGG